MGTRAILSQKQNLAYGKPQGNPHGKPIMVKFYRGNMARKKHVSPSRQRYEQGHPVIAVRVNKDLYDKLKVIKESDEKSFGDILKLGLNVQKATATKSYQEGYNKGYADAEELFDEKSALADQKLKLVEDLQKTLFRRSFHA